MTIQLWRGYHSADLAAAVGRAWDYDSLLILCPPLLQDFSFLGALPAGHLEFLGSWSAEEIAALSAIARDSHSELREQPVLGVFTSGTLSLTPRLALYSKRNVSISLEGIYQLFDHSRIQHVFCYPQAFHTFGLTLGYVASHLYGWTLHTPEGKYQSASHLQRIQLREENVLTLGTPTHFFDLMVNLKKWKESLTPSYSCILGGATVSRFLWKRVQEELHIEAPSVGYGCTEAAPGITHLPPGQSPMVDDEVGLPLPSITSRLVPEQGVEISGGSLCVGLIQDGKLTIPESVMVRDRLEVASHGGWIYRGRFDLLINRGGAKYSLEAIEKTIWDQAGVNAVACGVRDSRLGEELAMALQNSPGRSSDQIMDSVQTLLREAFALKLNPEHTRFVEEFPLNECSKLDRKSVQNMLSAKAGGALEN